MLCPLVYKVMERVPIVVNHSFLIRKTVSGCQTFATKSKNYEKNTKRDVPLSSGDSESGDKIVDKTGKPQNIDDKMLKPLGTPETR